MKDDKRRVLTLLTFSFLILLCVLMMQPLEILGFYHYIDILFPKGMIAERQLDLLLIIQGIMLVVVIPVFFITYYFSWKYRASNKKAKYDPKFNDHPIAELIWWSLPVIVVAAIAVVTWIETFALDPYKPIPSEKETVEIQAVALQWRWLFIYPNEGVATMNTLHIPVDRPVHFEITADAPMNSLWIPELGGQIYAMPKMRTELNLIANETGKFRGRSANISGKGFADMHFYTHATSEAEYRNWLRSARRSGELLTFDSYKELAKPTEDTEVLYFRIQDNSLFNQIIGQYLHPQKER